MNRNIEIKALVSNRLHFCNIAESICDNQKTVTHVDTYFVCTNGRLKLRVSDYDSAELIFYQRENNPSPKISQYLRYPAKEWKSLLEFLKRSFDIRGVVRKKRTIFLVGQNHIHIDEVEDLGLFAELEVIMEPYQSIEVSKQVLQELMLRLGIREEELVSGSYIDLIEKKNSILKDTESTFFSKVLM